MKKVIFKSKLFYTFLICYVGVLLLYNIFTFFETNDLGSLIPVAIEIILIVLISTNSQYAKIGIYIWGAISLIVGSGFEALADLMDGISANNLNSFIYNIAGLFVGVLIIYYTQRNVFVE